MVVLPQEKIYLVFLKAGVRGRFTLPHGLCPSWTAAHGHPQHHLVTTWLLSLLSRYLYLSIDLAAL